MITFILESNSIRISVYWILFSRISKRTLGIAWNSVSEKETVSWWEEIWCPTTFYLAGLQGHDKLEKYNIQKEYLFVFLPHQIHSIFSHVTKLITAVYKYMHNQIAIDLAMHFFDVPCLNLICKAVLHYFKLSMICDSWIFKSNLHLPFWYACLLAICLYICPFVLYLFVNCFIEIMIL